MRAESLRSIKGLLNANTGSATAASRVRPASCRDRSGGGGDHYVVRFIELGERAESQMLGLDRKAVDGRVRVFQSSEPLADGSLMRNRGAAALMAASMVVVIACQSAPSSASRSSSEARGPSQASSQPVLLSDYLFWPGMCDFTSWYDCTSPFGWTVDLNRIRRPRTLEAGHGDIFEHLVWKRWSAKGAVAHGRMRRSSPPSGRPVLLFLGGAATLTCPSTSGGKTVSFNSYTKFGWRKGYRKGTTIGATPSGPVTLTRGYWYDLEPVGRMRGRSRTYLCR